MGIRLFLLTLLSMSTALINKVNAQSFCNTPQESSNIDLFNNSASLVQAFDQYTLKIYVHVIRRSNGTGGQTASSVNQAVDVLDADFNPHGVYFEWDGTIDYINNDGYYFSPGSNIFGVNNHSDGIDIYLFPDDGIGGGLANGVGESSEFFVSGSWNDGLPLATSHVISHEMGHVIFLWHTHHGTAYEGGDPVQCPELVNGSNGSTCGDYVDDTPADPFLDFNVDGSCNWLGTGTDANGESYTPDAEQIMAYTEPSCMSHLSNGQGIRMRQAIATLPHLINATVSSGNCSPNLTLSSAIINGTHSFLAANAIVSTSQISGNADVIYGANNSVKMNLGFKVSAGTHFHASLNGCSGSSAREVTPERIEGQLATALDQSVELYPNPTKGSFSLKMDKQQFPASFAVYSISGSLLQQGVVTDTHQKVLVKSAEKGSYLIKITGKNSSFTRKLVVE